MKLITNFYRKAAKAAKHRRAEFSKTKILCVPLRPQRLCGYLFLCSLGTLAAQPPARPFGEGTITRTSDGRTAITTRYGNGTITRFSDGKTATTTRYGKGTITRTSDGKTAITSPYGKQPSVSGQKPAVSGQKRK